MNISEGKTFTVTKTPTHLHVYHARSHWWSLDLSLKVYQRAMVRSVLGVKRTELVTPRCARKLEWPMQGTTLLGQNGSGRVTLEERRRRRGRHLFLADWWNEVGQVWGNVVEKTWIGGLELKMKHISYKIKNDLLIQFMKHGNKVYIVYYYFFVVISPELEHFTIHD